MKRILIPVLALVLIAAAPANRTDFVFDERIPADNQQMLQQALTSALQSQTDDGATVIISLRVVEPEPERGLVLAGKAEEPRQGSPTPAERTR
ncbi:MAG TPA: hypothetical protein VE974_27030 [Thermoanaerobaculia bacterium]|nr:hypothetical protein [Thermoanaerobaculia bacterium]